MTSIEHTPVAGQVAVVTGGGRGIGRAIALSLAGAGASVAVLARSATEIEEVAGQVERGGGTAFAATVDVTDQESVRSAMDAVTDQLGAVDLLVNNAQSPAADHAGRMDHVTSGDRPRQRADTAGDHDYG